MSWILWAAFMLLPAGLIEPPPTEAKVRAEIQRLERRNSESTRLEALQWLRRRAAAKHTGLAIPALERTIRDDPVSKVREEAVLALYQLAEKQKQPCPLVLLQAILDEDEFVHQTARGVSGQFAAFASGSVELLLRGAWSD